MLYSRTNYTTEGTATQYDEDIKDEFLQNKTMNKKIATKFNIENVLNKTYVPDIENYNDRVFEQYDGKYTIAEELCLFCTLFKTEFFLQNGMFDEDFATVGGESKMFHYKSYKKLRYPIHCLDTFVYHNGNTTSDGFGNDFVENKKRSDMMFESKKKEDIEDTQSSIIKNTKFLTGNIKILAIRDDGIGDIIMSLLVLNGLKKVPL